VHAARPKAIPDLTLDDVDLPNRRITIAGAGHRQPLGELTCHALLAWLAHRRATWPNTTNRPIRRDRILHEALATGAGTRSIGEPELLRVFSATSRTRPIQTGHNRTERQAVLDRIRAGRTTGQGLFRLMVAGVVAGVGFEPT
jgi:hypothetical protein